MNKEVAQKWVDALRSGEYQQGQNGLRTLRGHCCLGVLCDLHRKNKGGGWSIESVTCNGITGFTYHDKHGGEVVAYPPSIVSEWAGLSGSFEDVLAQENDTGKSFDEIASMIEEKAGL